MPQHTFDTSTAEGRTARARLAAQTRWANTKDKTAATAPGRKAFLSRFGSDEERFSYFSEMGKKSAIARRKK